MAAVRCSTCPTGNFQLSNFKHHWAFFLVFRNVRFSLIGTTHSLIMCNGLSEYMQRSLRI